MLILGIDTSQSVCHLALVEDGAVVGQCGSMTGRYTEGLLTEIDELFASASRKLSELGAIAVCLGPGSFTGVRNSLATAQGIAFARNLPIVGISSTMLYGWLTLPSDSEYQVAIPASATDCYTSTFRFSGMANCRNRILLSASELSVCLLTTINPEALINVGDSESPNSAGHPGVVAGWIAENHLNSPLESAHRHVFSAVNGLSLAPLYAKGVNAMTIEERARR